MDLITHGELGLFVIAWTTFLVGGQSEACPGGIATLMTNYEITGKSSDAGFVWVRPGARYVVTCNPNCSSVAGYSATRNSTNTTLTIESVMCRDEGVWMLMDANDVNEIRTPVCHLSLREVTTCRPNINITTATMSTAARIPVTNSSPNINITTATTSTAARIPVTTSSPNINITAATTSTAARISVSIIMNMVFVWLVIPMAIIVVFMVAVCRIRNTQPQLYMNEADNTEQSKLVVNGILLM